MHKKRSNFSQQQRHAHACMHPISGVYALTLLCCSLDAACAARSKRLLAVALHCPQRHLSACVLAHRVDERCVAHQAMRAVGPTDGSGYVLLHLSAAECALFAAACSSLQRLRRAVPARVPPLHCALATAHTMSRSERSKAAGTALWSILEEDVVLGFGAELRHGAAVHRC
jgi:hypothetical protein